ncbi:efflux RND transporter permease subunit [Verrucomicrobia bacterium]|nr:efflux RND transporter permease subunit [Verrucomicrobiota bacterium]
MIRWFTNNGIAANLLMIGILLGGIYTAFKIPLEVIPSTDWQTVSMEVIYPGATAKDVEKGVLIPVEEALEGLSGIKKINSDGERNRAKFYFQAEKGTDLIELRENIRGRIERISSFPQETEPPRIYIPNTSNYFPVISIAVTGNLQEQDLREITHRVRDDLLEIEGISQARTQGDRDYEIAIEANMSKLESYNVGFRELSDAIRRSSIDLPAGSINSESGNLVVRTRGQAYVKEDFEKIPIRASNGANVLLGEVAKINDGFEENNVITEFNGRPAMFVQVMRTGDESAIDISNKVQEYIQGSPNRFPEGIFLYTWDDKSLSMRGRLGTLTSSLLQGCLLVFLVLSLFLRPKLAFWVVLGIPISFAGGVMLMPVMGITANVMSLFGFIIVLGVVVDDAIVTGENVYSKLQAGMNPLEASVLGTKEVTVPVTFGILTTIVAFVPLLFFEGRWGSFAGQIPPIVAPVLLFSLVESKLILPAHLKHITPRGNNLSAIGRFQKRIASSLEIFVEKIYEPSLQFAIRWRFSVITTFVAMALIMAGLCTSGRLGFSSFPSVESLKVTASLNLPNNLKIDKTKELINQISAATEKLKEEFIDPGTGKSLIRNVAKVTGSYRLGGRYDHSRGQVIAEVIPPSQRSEPGPRNSKIASRWKEIIGEIEEADNFSIRAELTGRRSSDDDKEADPLELELRGPNSVKKNYIAQEIKELLGKFEGINSSWAQINRGQDELEFTLKSRAIELGLTQQSLARQVRQSFYGEEAQRIMRGTDEIKVMVRLPQKDRESLHTLSKIKIRTPSGTEVPLSTVAEFKPTKSPTHVERNDGAEVIRIGAAPADEEVDIIGIARELTPQIQEKVNQEEGLSFQFTGHVAEHEESIKRTKIGAIALCFALFTLLAIPFKSVMQPIYVLLAIPFGVIGALLGHMIMGINISFLSIFGMLALAGVVVNDSLVMVDYINRRQAEGLSLREACMKAGPRRFRPILLTSLTTFAGLVPLLMDQSLQAQFLIPMAVSLGYGVLFATAITLYLIPCSLICAEDIGKLIRFYYRKVYPKTNSSS